MARAIRWQIPFRSRKDIACRIDIYDEEWQGAVTTLSTTSVGSPGYPAADPISWEEDNDESLLTAIRTKTGYINLIEASAGSLSDLYPDTPSQRYVEVYYGADMVFNGYIQPQTFDGAYNHQHDEVSLPVQSPLALTKGMELTGYTTPTTAASVLQRIMTDLHAAYTRYILPYQYDNFVLRASTLCYPREKPEGFGSAAYDSMTYYDFLDGVCRLWGLILHDTPTMLVFSRYDYNGLYSDNQSYGTTTDVLMETFSLGRDDNSMTRILPLRQIVINYEGNNNTSDRIGIQGSIYANQATYTDILGSVGYVFLTPLSLVSIRTHQLTNNDIVNNAGNVQNAGIMMLHAELRNRDNNYEGVLIKCEGSWSKPTTTTWGYSELLTYKFPSLPYTSDVTNSVIYIEAGIGDDAMEAFKCETVAPMKCRIHCGNIYYGYDVNNNPVWDKHPYTKDLSYNGHIWLQIPPPGPHLEVDILTHTLYETGKYIFIREVRYESSMALLTDYNPAYQLQRTIKGSQPTDGEEEVSVPFSLTHHNSNTLISEWWDDGWPLPDPEETKSPVEEPSYPYMFTTQRQATMVLHCDTFPANIYLRRWNFDGRTWRVISVAFSPIDDEYVIQLNSSDYS